jgi:hypothetical protein
VVFTAAFTIEAVLKIIAFGFKPYMSFFQNIIDILIVISSLVMLFLDTMAEISVIKVRAGLDQGRQSRAKHGQVLLPGLRMRPCWVCCHKQDACPACMYASGLRSGRQSASR